MRYSHYIVNKRINELEKNYKKDNFNEKCLQCHVKLSERHVELDYLSMVAFSYEFTVAYSDSIFFNILCVCLLPSFKHRK